MKINSKILSVPPYISTTWNNVAGLHLKGSQLVVNLVFGETIAIPGLAQETLNAIFHAHAEFLEQDTSKPSRQTAAPNPFITGFLMQPDQGMEGPVRFGMGGLDGLTSALQHNQAQAHAPDLPKEILSKIASIAKIVAPEDMAALPKAEPHCNCPHCQIARVIYSTRDEIQENVKSEREEEVVTDEDLTFQQWDITQTGDKMFSVTNRLDTKEKYSVYLGNPVGCTCGKAGCEHILAVLKS